MQRLVLATLCLCVALAAAAVAAGGLSPEDTQKLHDYTLSMDKVKAMQAATDDARPIQQKMTDQGQAPGNNAKSLAEMEAKLIALPMLYAAYTKHGLTAEDAVLMPFVLMNAGVVVAYPSAAAKLSASTSPAQVAFYKEHQQELQAMPWLTGGSGKGN